MTERAVTPGELGLPESIPLPARTDWRIGLVGYGNIAGAHVEACRQAGWPIVAVADPDPAARERARALDGVAAVYDDYPDLVADDRVEVVALLTQPTLREPVVAAAAAAGKPILVEKPLATTLAEAERMVRLAQQAGIPFAVSQNYRWEPANYYARRLIDQGLVGDVFLAAIEIQGEQDVTVAGHPFYSRCEDFLTVQWNNHLADLLRYWTGRDARRVFCCTRRMAGQNFTSDNLLVSLADFGEGVTGHILHSELLRSGPGHARCRVDGSEGSLEFDLYGPALQIRSKPLGGETLVLDPSSCRLMSSFAGPMGDLLRSIEERREPETSARRNLATVHHILAEARSARAGGTWVDL